MLTLLPDGLCKLVKLFDTELRCRSLKSGYSYLPVVFILGFMYFGFTFHVLCFKDTERQLKTGYVRHCIVTEEGFGNYKYPFSCTDPYFPEIDYTVTEALPGTPCVTHNGIQHPHNVSIVVRISKY